MTPLQDKIYQFIQSYLETHAYSPSLSEIAQGLGLSAKSVSLISRNIHALVANGHLKIDKKGYRNLAMVSNHSLSLPFLGRIAAGAPIEAVEDKQQINLDEFFKSDNAFALQVKGDSMIDEGILDGDFVICVHSTQAREGEIVVALIDDANATLKRISYKIKDRITLIPANPNLKAKAYLPNRISVQGIFKGLLRVPH